jgi:hypothetical protein
MHSFRFKATAWHEVSTAFRKGLSKANPEIEYITRERGDSNTLTDSESIKEASDHTRSARFYSKKHYFLARVGELKWISIYSGIGGMETSTSSIIW